MTLQLNIIKSLLITYFYGTINSQLQDLNHWFRLIVNIQILTLGLQKIVKYFLMVPMASKD